MIPVYLSKYNWKPGMDGLQFHWEKGEIIRARLQNGEWHEVRVDSDLLRHPTSPSGYCYECVFLDGSGRWALDPRNFEPLPAKQREYAAGLESVAG